MVTLTRTEIAWIKLAVKHEAEELRKVGSPLAVHSAENMERVLQKMEDVIATGAKRIEVKG